MRKFYGRFNSKSNTYRTGTGQKLQNIHRADQCQGEYCVIHSPSNHNMRRLRTHWRSDRSLMERICLHGVGHPDPDAIMRPGDDVHGCDGCCGLDRPDLVVVERTS